MIPEWVSDYIGIPFLDHGRDRRGCDCWGLVRLVFCERLGIKLPSFSTYYKNDTSYIDIANTILAQEQTGEWNLIQNGDEKLFDIAQMTVPIKVDGRWQRAPLHIGIVVDPKEWLLHIDKAVDSSLMKYKDSKKIVAFWRHS